MTASSLITISVIVPTYNRCDLLVDAIESFCLQSYNPREFEIIVSDNNSSDNTRNEVLKLAAKHKYPRIIYHFEARQGVHFARNSAAHLAHGKILYFTDDDMIADCSLLAELEKVFALDPKIACVTGAVLPKWEAEPPHWVSKYLSNSLLSLNIRREQLIIAPFDIGCFSCHQSILKNRFFETGGFHPENTAGVWIGDGETGLNQIILHKGYLFGYTSKSIIYHSIPPARMTQKYLNKRMYNQGFCDSYTYFRATRFCANQKPKIALKLLISLSRIIPSLLQAVIKRLMLRDSWHIDHGRAFYYAAIVSYIFKLLSSKDWRALVLHDDWLNSSAEVPQSKL
jgi:glycosyltransferase involved in cell wall biosynthesis